MSGCCLPRKPGAKDASRTDGHPVAYRLAARRRLLIAAIFLPAGTTLLANGITITPGKGVLGQTMARPLWPGFAVNTLFYAVVLRLLICGPFELRRVIRVKRGLCPACGYDLRHGGHDACPECGRLPSAR